MIETNIDDMSPELTGYVVEKLFEGGALDVFLTPIFMKKNRPATMLSVLCTQERVEALTGVILTETTTFGVRRYTVERSKLARDFVEVATQWGVVRVKRGYWGDGVIKTVPEYEDCKRLAEENEVALRQVFEEAIRCLS